MTTSEIEIGEMTALKPAAKRRPVVWLRNPMVAREGEKIGAGFFVFRRGDGTYRVRPAMWPFEHESLERAIGEARKLAKAHPGERFEVFASAAGPFIHVPAGTLGAEDMVE